MSPAARMQALLEVLLFLAREEGGIANNTCTLDEILHKSIDALSEQIVAEAPSAMGFCVVQNMIGNAIQHSGEGRIDVQLREHEFTVQDMGRGIPEVALQRIFERRYHGADSHGLGLYIVQRICTRLGWKIIANNADGAGARFAVRFAP